MLIFLQKNADISKFKSALALKGIFSETTYMCVYLFTKFQVSSKIPCLFSPTTLLKRGSNSDVFLRNLRNF